MKSPKRQKILSLALKNSFQSEYYVVDNGYSCAVLKLNTEMFNEPESFNMTLRQVHDCGKRSYFFVTIISQGPIAYFLELNIPLKIGKLIFYRLHLRKSHLH